MATNFLKTQSFFGGALVIDEGGTPVVGSIRLEGDTGGILGAISDVTLSTAGLATKAAETKLAGGEFDALAEVGQALTTQPAPQPQVSPLQPAPQSQPTTQPSAPSAATLLLGAAVAFLLLRS
jgi:hypothetical protein